MANQEAERLWEFVEQIKQGTTTVAADDPLLRLAQFTGEAVGEKLPAYENDRTFAREQLTAVIEEGKTARDTNPRRERRTLRSITFPLVPRRAVWSLASVTFVLIGLAVFRWRVSLPPPIAASVLVKDHIELLAKKPFATYENADATRVAFWLTHKVGFPVVAVDLSKTGAKLLGGRRCQLAGQPIGLSFYQDHDTRISLFQLQGKQSRPAGVEEVNVSGRRFFVGSDKGFNIVAWQGRETFCALVSALDTTTLLRLADVGAKQTEE